MHAGRPPWFNKDGGVRKEPFFIGISGGSASGKTTVATNIIKQLDVQWVNYIPYYTKTIRGSLQIRNKSRQILFHVV